jgi:Family of unknown function (DUF6152)
MLSKFALSGSAATIMIVILAAHAVGHHSFAPHFDRSRQVDISGTVTGYEARNPHSYLHISAVDENGRTREYVCESHGVTQLTRIGITPQLLKAGTKVRVTGPISRHSPYMCFFQTVELADGRSFNVDGPGGSQQTPPQAKLPPRRDIFGTWLLTPVRNRNTGGQPPPKPVLTPAGEKAVAAYDPFKDDPVFHCDPVAVARVWQAPSTPLEIVRNGNDIILHAEWMDVRRVIHMDMKTLVIETANYPAGVLEQYVEQPGQPTKARLHSAALTTVERLHLDATRQRLIVDVDFTDPEFFKQPPARDTMEYSPSDLKIEPFKCSPEGLTGTIR